MMDIEDLIDMAVDAGARDFGNPDMWGVLQMSYESLERFAKEVAAQERRKCEDEALTKNIVANWPHDKWVGLTDEDKESFWTADEMTGEEWDELFNEVENKLRSKNT